MKKILSYILISLIIFVNLLAPFSVGISSTKGINIKKNITNAQDTWDGTVNGYQTAFPNSSLTATNSVFIPDMGGDTSKDSSNVALTLRVDTGVPEGSPSLNNWLHVKPEASKMGSFLNDLTWGLAGTSYRTFNQNNTFVLKVVESGTNRTGYIDATSFILKGFSDKRWTDKGEQGMVNAIVNDISFNQITSDGKATGLTFFKPGTNYDISLYYYSSVLYEIDPAPTKGPEIIPGLENNGQAYFKIASTSVLTASKEKPYIGKVVETGKQVVTGSDSMAMPACGVMPGSSGTIPGCIAQGFYYIFFQPTSYLFALAGTFFDYSFAYSVQDSSYRSSFVVEGWGLVRDFCNMFFIFIMLYVAIGTILSLHSMKTKETIINVVIIGLFINFSLFATQLIIDASNITARVFYNSDAIKITEKGPTGATSVVAKIADNGAIPLSAALVNKVNPQNIIINAREINKIANNSTAGLTDVDTGDGGGIGVGQFILIVILASAINIVGFTVFITIGFLFVARVIGLWMAMILAPLAFFTYILPEMADTKTIGWKHWWPETIKMAFLAPVFIFFMYIILKFLQMDLISDASGKSGLDFLIAAIIPFVFIIILLLKAKKIAVDMSGEFGEYATKMGSAVGGMALGGAVGIGAVAMRSTVGRYGAGIADSEKWKAMEAKGGFKGFMAKNLRNIGSTAGKASFDARNTKLGASAGKGMGVDAGKGKEGGFTKARIDQKIKAEKRAKELEPGENAEVNKKLREKEAQQKKMENELNPGIEDATAAIAAAKEKSEVLRNKSNANPGDLELKKEYQTALNKLDEERAVLANLTTGGKSSKNNEDGTSKYNTHNGSITKTEHDEISAKFTKDENAFKEAKLKEENAGKDAQTQKEATIAANEKAQKDTEDRAIAEAEKIKTEGQKQANAILAEAQKAELEAIAAFSAASANAAKNPTTDNVRMADRARAMRDSAVANTGIAVTNSAQMKSDADAAAKKLVDDAKTKAAEEKKVADEKAEQDRLDFIEAAKNTRGEAEKQMEASKKVLDEAQKSADRIDPKTGLKLGYGITLSAAKKETHHAKVDVDKVKNARKEDIAKDLESRSSKVFNMIVTGGQYSTDAANISAHNIRMGVKTEPAPSSGGHGGGGHDSHAGGGDSHAKPAGGGGGHDAHAKPAGGHDAHAKPAH